MLAGLLCLATLSWACRREPEFTRPDVVDKNTVRPEVLSQPVPVVTNATNQAK